MMRFRFVALTLITASCLAIGAQAQSLQTLDIPDEVIAELNGEPMDFELSSPQTAIIEVSLTSDDFDPYLELLDAEGNTLGENDDGSDGSTGTGSLLSFLAEADTVYMIRASSYSGGASGDFKLVVSDKEVSEISIDEPAITDLKNESEYFTFEGKEGDDVDFIVGADSFDTVLAVIDAYGNTLMSSDDGDELNPFISDFLVPADGIYILRLSVSIYSVAPPTDPIQLSVRPTTIQDIAFDEVLRSEQEKSYLRFEAQAGATYLIEVQATVPSRFNVEVRPRMSESSEVSSNAYGTTSLAFTFTPATDGSYKLTIGGKSSNLEYMPYTTTITEVK